MINWSILSKKFGRLEGSKRFENLAFKYVCDVYSEYTWIPTATTSDNNKDAHLGKGTEFDIWEEAKFKGEKYKIRRQDLDTTILSGIIQGNVRMIIFVSNALVPEKLYSRADVSAKMKGIEITYALDAQLESWLVKHPETYREVFEEELDSKISLQAVQEIKSIYIYDTTSIAFNPLSENTELLVGEKYILSVTILSSKEGCVANVNFNETAPFAIIKNSSFSEQTGIVLKNGINVINLLVEARHEFFNRVSVRIDIDGTPYFGVTQNLLIQQGSTLPIVYTEQIEILHKIKSTVDIYNTNSMTHIFTLLAESGMGKSYILHSIYLDFLFKRDIANIDFEMSTINNVNYQLLCKIVLYLNFGNIFLYTNMNDSSSRNDLRNIAINANLGNKLSNDELGCLIDGCYDTVSAMTIINSLVLKCRRNPNTIIVSTINNKISKLLLIDDIQYLNELQYELIAILCNQCERVKKKITIILSGTKGKFDTEVQEKDFSNLSINTFSLNGLSSMDKLVSMKNLVSGVKNNDIEIVNSIIPESPLLAYEILHNIKLLSNISNIFEVIKNYNHSIEGNAIFQNKFNNLNKIQLAILDIIYMFKLGINYSYITAYYNASNINIKACIEKLEKERLITKKGNYIRPYHDYCTISYLKFRKGKIYNYTTAAFLEYLLSKNYPDENLLISNLIKCGKKYYNKYKKQIDSIINTSIHTTNFGMALYYCEYYYNSLINKDENAYSKRELYLLYLYADCLVHCGKNNQAEKIFEWLCKITSTNTVENVESKASLLNQWFWHMKLDTLIADSCVLQDSIEKIISSDLNKDEYARIAKAEDSCYNRRMVTQLLLDDYESAKRTYEIRLKKLAKTHSVENFKKISATIIMDYARGISYYSPKSAYRIIRVAEKYYSCDFDSQYRRAVLCKIDKLVLLCINSNFFDENEFNLYMQKLKAEKFHSEYFKSILKYYACKMICESKIIQDSGLNDFKTTTIQYLYDNIHKCMLDININPDYREKYLYNILISYVHILDKDFSQAETCLNQAYTFISKAGKSHLISLEHNLINMHSIKRIEWFSKNKELQLDCYYLDCRFW